MASSATNRPLRDHPPILSPGARNMWAALIVAALLFVLVGALTIPFAVESSSMWYQFGAAKASLRAGKMIGIAAGLLLLLQLPLAGRLTSLDRIFSLPGLMRQHRWHAWASMVLAVTHPLCILLPEGTLTIPWELRYWPEWVGAGLLFCVVAQVTASCWRRSLGIAFHVWLPLHRMVGWLIVGLLIVHVLYVSESFSEPGLPRTMTMVAAVLCLGLWLWVRTGWWRARRQRFTVSRVGVTGADCTSVVLTPTTPSSFSYAPGQFAYVSFRSPAVSAEPHPFTIASTPSRPERLQFIIRACGDGTRRLSRLSPGDTARVQGPFGRFGHLFTAGNRALILIAGGIGITPMLSMLRFMADRGDERPVTLIWSNRSRDHVVVAEEMEALANQLTGLRYVPIFTRQGAKGNHARRLDRAMLAALLDESSRNAAVFVCGPVGMMRQTTADLKALGVPARSIFTEAFGW